MGEMANAATSHETQTNTSTTKPPGHSSQDTSGRILRPDDIDSEALTGFSSVAGHETQTNASTTELRNCPLPGAPSVFVGNGTDEVLALAFQAFFGGKGNILTPDISYGFYPVWGGMYDVGLNFVPVEKDFSIDAAKYRSGNGVVIANPNAPTSLAVGLDAIEAILRQNPDGVVLVDEAYIDFADVPSAVELLPKYENLLVVRTFSKSHALAGMRVGYAIGHPSLIEALHLMKESFNSYPLDIIAQKAAAAAYSDAAYLESTVKKVIATRSKTIRALAELGYQTLPSQANFILIKIGQRSEELY